MQLDGLIVTKTLLFQFMLVLSWLLQPLSLRKLKEEKKANCRKVKNKRLTPSIGLEAKFLPFQQKG